jgi:hypothetical protein
MSNANAISDLERSEHDATYGVKKTSLWGYDPVVDSLRRITVSADGQIITVGDDPLFPFKISDLDDDETTSGYNYYGYEKNSGAWYIMREDLDNKAYRYATGATDYATNWGNRIISLTYDYLSNVTIY